MKFKFKAVWLLPIILTVTACANQGGLKDGNLERASDEAAMAALNSGDADQAAIIYANQYERNPTAENAVKEAKALRLGGSAQKAVLFLQNISSKHSGSAEFYTELGRSSLAGGYMPESLAALTKAVTLPGADWKTWLVFGAYQARQGNYTLAQNYFNRAVELTQNPQQALSAQADIALAKAESGDISSALADLRMLSNRPGADPRIKINLDVLTEMQSGASEEPKNYPRARVRRNHWQQRSIVGTQQPSADMH